MAKLRFVILFALTAITASLPIVYAINSAGENWRGIMPLFATDVNFYLAKLVKGTFNFPFGNNPFFLEHINNINATPSVADYISAVPYKFGLSLPNTLILNAILWHCIFVYLLYLILKRLGVKNNWNFWLIVPAYISVYGMILKPAVLQVVMPFFLFFLLALLHWLDASTKNRNILLALGLAGTIYIYPYTWQISCVSLGLVFLWLLKKQDWQKAGSLIKVSLCGLLLALPVIWYMYQEITHPLFSDIVERSGSINTHLPSITSFYAGRWIFTGLGLWYLAMYFWPDLKKDREFKTAFYFFGLIGSAILLILMSPIISGRDAMIGTHLSREVFFWLSLSVGCAVYFIFQKTDFKRKVNYKTFFVLVFVVINIVPLLRQYERSLKQPFQTSAEEAIQIQDFAEPMAWLDRYDSTPGVIWANSEISTYVSFVSRHYVLTLLAHQYFVDVLELQERQLVARYFSDNTPQLIEQDYEILFGYNYEQESINFNLRSWICKKTGFIFCNDLGASVLLLEKEKNIQNLFQYNKEYVRPNIYELLKKYHVTYAVKDIKNDRDLQFDKLKNTKEIYNDGRFIIYKFYYQ